VLNAVGEPVAYKPVPVHASTPLMLPLAMISRTYGPAVSPVRPWSW
jgi:hypothetical protein